MAPVSKASVFMDSSRLLTDQFGPQLLLKFVVLIVKRGCCVSCEGNHKEEKSSDSKSKQHKQGNQNQQLKNTHKKMHKHTDNQSSRHMETWAERQIIGYPKASDQFAFCFDDRLGDGISTPRVLSSVCCLTMIRFVSPREFLASWFWLRSGDTGFQNFFLN